MVKLKATLHMDITRWSILKSLIIVFTAEDGKFYTVSKNKTSS